MIEDGEKERIPFDLWDIGLAFWWGAMPSAFGLLMLLAQYTVRHNDEVRTTLLESAQKALPTLRKALPVLTTGVSVSPAPEAPPEQTTEASPGDFLSALEDGKPHVLLVGHTGGGKTTVLHALARHQAAQGVKTVVCDIDSIEGSYPGYRVVGSGDDYASIAKVLQLVEKEVAKRREQRKHGKRTFSPVWLLIDEVHDVVAELDCWSVLENIIRRGRKLNIRLVIGTQDSQVRTLGLEGKSQLLVNLARVDLRKEGSRRTTIIDGTRYTVPDLPDVDETVTPPETTPRAEPTSTDDLLASLLNVQVERLNVQTVQPERSNRSDIVQPRSDAVERRSGERSPERSDTVQSPEITEITESERHKLAQSVALYRAGKSKQASIEPVWNVKKGGSSAWKRALFLLDSVLDGTLEIEASGDLWQSYLGDREWE